MSAALVTTCIVIVLMGSVVPASSASFTYPYKGTQHSWTNGTGPFGSAGGSNRVSSPGFNLTNGMGTANESFWGNSTVMPSTNLGWNVSGASDNDSYEFTIDVPFNNQSGTRTLSQVNVTFNYAADGKISVKPGTCVWTRYTTRQKSFCSGGASVYAGVGSTFMSFARGGHVVKARCSAGCYSTLAAESFSIWNGSKGISRYVRHAAVASSNGWLVDTSKLGTYTFGSPSATSLLFTETKPIRASGTIVLRLFAWVDAGVTFEYPTGQGGLLGAKGDISVAFSFQLTSIVET